MAVDRGGLDYKIDLGGTLETRLESFIAKVAQLDAALTKLKGTASSPVAGGGGSSRSTSSSRPTALSDLEKARNSEAKKAIKTTNAFEKERYDIANKFAAERVKVIGNANKSIVKQQAAVIKSAKASAQVFKEYYADLDKKEAFRVKQAQNYNKELTKQQDIVSKSARDSAQVFKDEAKAVQARRADVASGREAIKATEAQAIASQKITKSANDLKVKEAQIAQLRTASVNAQGKMTLSQRAAAEQVGVSAAQAKKLGLRMWDAEHAARQFLFTFRRLVGILAIFTLARKLAQAIGSAVGEMASFNAELETSKNGIAVVLASVSQVRNSSGELVTGQEAFNAALQVSDDILRKLKKDALGSIATFQSLVQAYQVAVGPGLAAGLDPDQVRKLTKSMVEAAITMNVPLNQLSEEIRSTLKGTATSKNTRLAALFGGAPELNKAVALAKEQGNLYEMLTERLAAVALGAKAASSSFNVLKSNLQDSVQLLLAEGGIEYFLQLKDALWGMSQAITSVDSSGNLGFTPEFLGLVQEVSGTLATIIKQFGELTDAGTNVSLFRNLLAGIGDVLKTIAPIAITGFQGILTGVNMVVAPIRAVFDALRAITRSIPGLGALGKILSTVVKYAIAGAVAFGLWNKLISVALWQKAFALIAMHAKNILASMLAMGILQKGITANAFLMAVATKEWAAAMAMVNLRALAMLGVWGLVLGVLAFILAKFGVFEKIIGFFNRGLSKADKQAIELEHSMSGAASATEDAANSAEEWADNLRKAGQELAKAKALQGLSGDAERYVSLLENAKMQIADQTKQKLEEIALQDREIANLKEQIVLNKRMLMGSPQSGLPNNFNAPGSVTFGGGRRSAEEAQELNLLSQIDASERQIVQTEAKRLKNAQEVVDTKERILRLLDRQIQAENYRAENPIETIDQDIAMTKAKDMVALNDILYDQANISVKELATLEAKNALNKAEYGLALKKAELAKKNTKEAWEESIADNASWMTILTLQDQYLKARDEETALIEEAGEAEKARTLELEKRQKLLSGNFSDALMDGLDDFIQELPALGVQISEIVTGALSDLSGTVASVFKDAIDPRKDLDLKTAFGEFFLDLAGQFVEALTAELLMKPFAEGLSKMISGGSKSSGGGIFGIFASLFTPTATPVGAATGGVIKGYASGGNITDFARPASIPASDTVPIWATPGEFMFRKGIVDKIGLPLLNAINSGMLNPASFGKTVAPRLAQNRSGIRGFAAGGSVDRSVGASRGNSSKTIVLPVLPASNNTMDQLIAGGRGAFASHMNKVHYTGDTNASKSWG